MSGELKRFKNTRASAQRLNDGYVFHGWVAWIEAARLGFRPNSTQEALMPNDVLRVRLSCFSGQTEFQGSVMGMAMGVGIVALPSCIRIEPPESAPRYSVSELPGQLLLPFGTVDIQICDVARGGIGLMSTEPLEPGARVRIRMLSGQGPIETEVQCAYCGEANDAALSYRIGLKFIGMGRLDAARWNQVLGEAHHASAA